MKEIRLYVCKGSKTYFVDFGDSPDQCSCEGIELLEANTVEASTEKHIPVVQDLNGTLQVTVGSQPHPMQPEHYIQWIFVQTKQGGMYCNLTPGQAPEAVFTVSLADVVGVYAYCNLHGLWKAEIAEEKEEGFHQTVCSAEFMDCIES